MSFAAILALGFFLGMRHATDTDHVVAVTTIVSREPSIRAAAFVGAIWGLGHSVTLLLVGGAILIFRFAIPPHVGLSMELAVAIMLILLGVMNVTELIRRFERTVKKNAKNSDSEATDRVRSPAPKRRALRRLVRPLIVGVVHGLAGSAAIALLILTTIQSALSSLGYLLVFGVGTIAGMTLLTVIMAAPLAIATQRFASFNRQMAQATGLLSIAFGAYLVYRIGIVDGLFSAHPRWTPE